MRKAIGGVAMLALLAGCAPEVGGRASFPVLSRAPLPGYTEKVATIDEKRCTHVVLFFVAWGDDPSHEALITDILTEHKGDAITDAELTYFSIPAFFYFQNCARVRGTVVRRAGGAAPASPPSGPPPVVPAAPPTGGAP